MYDITSSIINGGIVDPPSIDQLNELFKDFNPGNLVVRMTMSRARYNQVKAATSPGAPSQLSELEIVASEAVLDNRIVRDYADGTMDILNLDTGKSSARIPKVPPLMMKP